MTAFLARHGETDWNRNRRWQGQTDTTLNTVGREQALTLAHALEPCHIARIHASDLSRARETAEIVARHLGISQVVTDADLRERNFGPFEGLTFAECEAKLPEMWHRYLADRTRPEGAESDPSLVGRMRRGMARAVAQEGTVLVVTHGGALRAYLQAMNVRSISSDDFAFPNGSAVRVHFERDPSERLVISAFGRLEDSPHEPELR